MVFSCVCSTYKRKQAKKGNQVLVEGRCNAIISLTQHQKNGTNSSGLLLSLQHLTYYHSFVSEVCSACIPLPQLIANRQDSKAAHLKLHSFKGSRL